MKVKFEDTSKKLSCYVYRIYQPGKGLLLWYINGEKATYQKVDVAASLILNISSTYTIDPSSDFIHGALSATCNYTSKYTSIPGLKTRRLLNPGKNYLCIKLYSITLMNACWLRQF